MVHVLALSHAEGQHVAGRSSRCLPGYYAPCTVHTLAPHVQLFQDHMSVGLHDCSKILDVSMVLQCVDTALKSKNFVSMLTTAVHNTSYNTAWSLWEGGTISSCL